MSAVLWDWISLLLRWAHVMLGILWIGASFHFIWLDASLRREADQPDGVVGASPVVANDEPVCIGCGGDAFR